MEEQLAMAEIAAAQWRQAHDYQKAQILNRLEAEMRESLLVDGQHVDELTLRRILKASQQALH
jgi:hypothetical protein